MPSNIGEETEKELSHRYVRAMERLVDVVQELSMARDLDGIVEIVRHAARDLTGADGATFVLREQDQCYYVDEAAIGPLWKGKRFPLESCISGWAMQNRKPAIIEDIYADDRIPIDAYRPTFVKSLVMVPIRASNPVGAIGTYWAARRSPAPEEVRVLQALADSTSVAMEKVQLYADLERKVADRTVRLQTLNEELEAFAYSVSHDLRAPLRHITGYAEMLREEAGDRLDPDCQRHVDVIVRSAETMKNLIANLLEFSRMSRAKLRRQAVDMNELVEEARREVVRDNPDREIRWVIGTLPGVEGDRAMLKQIWMNFLCNAVKFTRDRDVAEIQIGAAPGDGMIEYAVRDNGAGFDQKSAGKLFRVFERLHDPNEFEGTGIGLALCRRIAARHGGQTRAEGIEDSGATFYFTLPAQTGP